MDREAFESHVYSRTGWHAIPGSLKNYNTLEAFKKSPKAQLLADAAAELWHSIKSGEAESNPNLVLKFVLISFADLKSFHFHYW